MISEYMLIKYFSRYAKIYDKSKKTKLMNNLT